jgi:hypothetical protein
MVGMVAQLKEKLMKLEEVVLIFTENDMEVRACYRARLQQLKTVEGQRVFSVSKEKAPFIIESIKDELV